MRSPFVLDGRCCLDRRCLQVILNRICLSLAAVSCRIPGAVPTYVRQALGFIFTLDKPQDRWGLEMLSVLPEEIASLDASRSLKVEIDEQMNELISEVLLRIDGISNVLLSQQLAMTDITSIMRSTILVLHSWMKYGLDLSGLYQEHRPTMVMLIAALQTRDNPCLLASCRFISELIDIASYPRDSFRNQAVHELITQLMYCAPILSECLAPRNDAMDDVAVAVCDCFNSIAYKETEYLVSVRSTHIDFIQLVLSLTKLRNRKLVSCTFDTWTSVGDISMTDRHPFARTDLFSTLTSNIMDALTYPASGSFHDADDEDDFHGFRCYTANGLEEVLHGSVYSLNEQFFVLLRERIQHQMSQAPNGFDWRVLECVSFVLRVVALPVKTSFTNKPDVVSFVTAFLSSILSLPIEFVVSAEGTVLGQQIAEVLRSYTFLLASPHAEGLFLQTVQYLFNMVLQGINNKAVSLAAAKCLVQYFTLGYAQLLVQVGTTTDNHAVYQVSPFLSGCVQSLAPALMSLETIVSNSEAFLQVLQGLLGVISHISPIAIAPAGDGILNPQDLISALGNGLLQHLQQLIQQPTVDSKTTIIVLAYIRQIIKFGNFDCSSGGSNPIQPLIAHLMPILQYIHNLPDIGKYEPLVESACSLFSEILGALNAMFCEYLSLLGEFIMKMLNLKLCRAAVLACARQTHEIFAAENNIQLSGISNYLMLMWDSVLSVLLPPQQQLTDINAIDPAMDWLNDPSIAEACLLLIHTYVLRTPELICQSPQLPRVCALLALCFRNCNEKGTIKALLQIVQALFCSISVRAAVKAALLHVGCQFGQEYMRDILLNLDGAAPEVLRTNLIDAIYTILLGCVTGGAESTNECKRWMATLIFQQLPAMPPRSTNPQQLLTPQPRWLWPKISDANKPVLLEKLFVFVAENKRKFRAMMLDIAKISAGEDTEDCLSSHFC
jgi:hypothetical protein